ncbi:MAG TPA: transposase [Gemmataceae bacterium]|nr:transposase [Gemmataceae bacterium]
MLERDTILAQRLEQFRHDFRACFRRREQAEWAAVYLQGLLRPGTRKTIENISRSITLPHGPQVDDVAQALQHFLNQSPWDENKLQRHYYSLLRERLGPDGLLVLDELSFVKQGRHSVGVQRQYSAVLGHKANCQLAVALHHLSPDGLRPLAMRLYLPRRWLEDKKRLDKAAVPESARRPASKTMLALELLDEARVAGISSTNVAPAIAWGRSDELAESVRERGLNWRAEVPPNSIDAVHRGRDRLHNELGLDHFEGRSWRGFHHHTCLVVLASGLLMGFEDGTVYMD